MSLKIQKIQLTETEWLLLEEILAVVDPNRRVTAVYKDGTMTLQCTKCQKIVHIHWMELLIKVIVPELLARLNRKDYYPIVVAKLFSSEDSLILSTIHYMMKRVDNGLEPCVDNLLKL